MIANNFEDTDIPIWRKDCDGYEYEFRNLFCRSGFAYRHKNGWIWMNGDFFTLRECKVYGVKPDTNNTKRRMRIE